MEWIFLSPHLDDAVYSCGGLIWNQAQSGEKVAIWTICAGDAPPGPLPPLAEELHARWEAGQEAVMVRREEDRRACARLGATPRHFQVPDCVYRRHPQTKAPLYPSWDSVFGQLHPVEAGLVEQLAELLQQDLPDRALLVCPLSIGGHVDHRLVVQVARRLAGLASCPLWFYTDYPYAARVTGYQSQIEARGGAFRSFEVPEVGMTAWVEAIALYASQISTFWASSGELDTAIRAFARQMGGVRLWQFPMSLGFFTCVPKELC